MDTFIDMLAYKSALVGIQVVITEEAYTSKLILSQLKNIHLTLADA